MPDPVVPREDSVDPIELRLETDTDTLVSSVLSNFSAPQFLNDLYPFIERKRVEIARLCSENALAFSSSISDLKNLGATASKLQNLVNSISEKLQATINNYNKELKSLDREADELSIIDKKIIAIQESIVLIQRLKNISDEIQVGNLHVATLLAHEFADYDSSPTSSHVFTLIHDDIDHVISEIYQEAFARFGKWLADFRTLCPQIGDAYLKGQPLPSFTCQPVYELCLISRHLGKEQSFAQEYLNRRKSQLEQLRSSCNSSSIFPMIAGFFLVEHLVSSDGFHLIPQSALDEMWRSAQTNITLTLGLPTEQLVDHYASVSLFCKRMTFLDCSPLISYLESKVPLLKRPLNKQAQTELSKIVIDGPSKDGYNMEDVKKYLGITSPEHFSPAVIAACKVFENSLESLIKAGGTSSNVMVSLFKQQLTVFCGYLEKFSQNGLFDASLALSSLSALTLSLPYFSKITKSVLDDKDIRDKKALVLSNMVSKVNEAILDLLDISFVRGGDCIQMLTTYVETNVSLCRESLEERDFVAFVKAIGESLAQRVKVLMHKADWTREKVRSIAQRVKELEDMAVLVAVSGSGSKLEGVRKGIEMAGEVMSEKGGRVIEGREWWNKWRNADKASALIVLKGALEGDKGAIDTVKARIERDM